MVDESRSLKREVEEFDTTLEKYQNLLANAEQFEKKLENDKKNSDFLRRQLEYIKRMSQRNTETPLNNSTPQKMMGKLVHFTDC